MACLLSKISFIRKIHRFFFRLYLEKKRKLNIVKTLWFNISFLPVLLFIFETLLILYLLFCCFMLQSFHNETCLC